MKRKEGKIIFGILTENKSVIWIHKMAVRRSVSTPGRPGLNEKNYQKKKKKKKIGEKNRKGDKRYSKIIITNNKKKRKKGKKKETKKKIDKQRAKKVHSGRTLKIPTSRAGALAWNTNGKPEKKFRPDGAEKNGQFYMTLRLNEELLESLISLVDHLILL